LDAINLACANRPDLIAVLRHARNRPTRDGEWVRALLARKPAKLAAVALAIA